MIKLRTFFIAYKIPKTSSFISASTVTDTFFLAKKGIDGLVVYDKEEDKYKDVVRLRWSKLVKRDKRAQDCPNYILKLFKSLKNLGWEVTDKEFRKEHYGCGKQKSDSDL